MSGGGCGVASGLVVLIMLITWPRQMFMMRDMDWENRRHGWHRRVFYVVASGLCILIEIGGYVGLDSLNWSLAGSVGTWADLALWGGLIAVAVPGLVIGAANVSLFWKEVPPPSGQGAIGRPEYVGPQHTRSASS